MVSFGKKGFKYVISYKYGNTIRPSYFMIPKLVHIEETLMKLNTCLFCQESDELLEKYIVSLKVNLYTMKNL